MLAGRRVHPRKGRRRHDARAVAREIATVNRVMRRAVHFAVLALLLLFMQQRAVVHPLEHLAGRAAAPQETTLGLPHVEIACAQCALLAGGADAVAAAWSMADTAPPTTLAPLVVPASAPIAATAWFDSRAPPRLA